MKTEFPTLNECPQWAPDAQTEVDAFLAARTAMEKTETALAAAVAAEAAAMEKRNAAGAVKARYEADRLRLQAEFDRAATRETLAAMAVKLVKAAWDGEHAVGEKRLAEQARLADAIAGVTGLPVKEAARIVHDGMGALGDLISENGAFIRRKNAWRSYCQ